MGGNAVNGIRMEKNVYLGVLPKISRLVKDFYGVEPIQVPYYRSKDSFGDMDLLIPLDSLSNLEIDRFLHYLENPRSFYNDKCLSILFDEKYQIDLIFVHKNRLKTKLNFLSWNDCGLLIGLMAKSMGCSFGDFGLKFYIDRSFSDIILSTDMKEILDFLGLNYEKWNSGFDSREDIFDFIVSGKYFKKELFGLDQMNSTNKSRNRKRPNYAMFIEYSKFYEDKEDPHRYTIEELDKVFPKSKCLDFYHIQEMEIEKSGLLNNKINGNILMLKYGWKGKELGDILRKFKGRMDKEILIDLSDEEAILYFEKIMPELF